MHGELLVFTDHKDKKSRYYLIEPQVISGKSVFFTSTLLENY